jgi:glutamate-1-semialdehyde 2,1-aminomutase
MIYPAIQKITSMQKVSNENAGIDRASDVKAKNAARSAQCAAEIELVIPGGVNSPFRSFAEVGGHTIFFDRASGARLTDIDGNTYIDFLGGWGPAILGHCPEQVVLACQRALALGPLTGTPHQSELWLAKTLTTLIDGLEKVRFVTSGTEAVMSAIRLARGFTNKDVLVMFEGCYHGHSDCTLASEGHRTSKGIPYETAKNTALAKFNDLDSLEQVLARHKAKVAAVLIEPVAGSMGVIPPQPGFLEGVRRLCTEYGALLIFDEVLTGFRIAIGGAQEYYEVAADLVCYGKGLGSGLPIGAYGGSAEIMDHLIPVREVGDVYQSGSFAGNPITMTAAIETIKLLRQPGVYERLEARTAQLFNGLDETIAELKIPVELQRVGSMFAILFAANPIRDFADSLNIDAPRFARFFHQLLNQGVYMPPSSVDAACVSAAHTKADIDEALNVFDQALRRVL